MNLVESPNRWSCLPASFAMALGLTLPQMIAHIGHDGSEILWPELPEPKRRRTFHLQECVAVAGVCGYVVCEYQFAPQLTPDGEHFFDVPVKLDIRKLMSVSIGVMTGLGKAHRHVVAWNGSHIFDPSGMVYDIENQSLFTPDAFFRIFQYQIK